MEERDSGLGILLLTDLVSYNPVQLPRRGFLCWQASSVSQGSGCPILEPLLRPSGCHNLVSPCVRPPGSWMDSQFQLSQFALAGGEGRSRESIWLLELGFQCLFFHL